MSYRKVIGAVEIGTSKVVVLVGEINDERRLNIIGMGQCPSMGVKKGEIVDFRAASDATHAALTAAEKNAKATIEGVYLSQTGGHLEGFSNRGTATVSDRDGLVSESDMQRAIEDAKRREVPGGRVYIHHIQNAKNLDGRVVEDPLTMRGAQLEIGYWHIHGDERKISDHIHVINGFGLEVEDMIVSSIASGSIAADDVDKQNGAIVLDIGCGTTDYVVFRGGHIVKSGVIRVGGDHLTNDLATGLRVNYEHAEKIKREFGKAMIDPTDKNDKVWLFGDLTIGDRAIPRKAIYQIIKARVEEIMMIIHHEVSSTVTLQNLAGGAILTGGTAHLPFIADEAARVFGIPARIAKVENIVKDELSGPEFSTVLGLLYYGMNAQISKNEARTNGRGLFGRVAKMFLS